MAVKLSLDLEAEQNRGIVDMAMQSSHGYHLVYKVVSYILRNTFGIRSGQRIIGYISESVDIAL